MQLLGFNLDGNLPELSPGDSASSIEQRLDVLRQAFQNADVALSLQAPELPAANDLMQRDKQSWTDEGQSTQASQAELINPPMTNKALEQDALNKLKDIYG